MNAQDENAKERIQQEPLTEDDNPKQGVSGLVLKTPKQYSQDACCATICRDLLLQQAKMHIKTQNQHEIKDPD